MGRASAEVEKSPSPFKEEEPPPLAAALYTAGSCKGQLLMWVAVALQPATDTFWYNTGAECLSHWAELRAMWIEFIKESGHLHVCTDNWAMYRGLTLWLPHCTA